MYHFGFYCKTININWVHSVLQVVVLSRDNAAKLGSADIRADEDGDTGDVRANMAKVDPKVDGDADDVRAKVDPKVDGGTDDVQAELDSVDVRSGNSVTTTLMSVQIE